MAQNYNGDANGFHNQYCDSHEHQARPPSYNPTINSVQNVSYAGFASLPAPDHSRLGHYGGNNMTTQPTSNPSHYAHASHTPFSMATSMLSGTATSMNLPFHPAAQNNSILPKLEPAPAINGDSVQRYDSRRDLQPLVSAGTSAESSPRHVVGSQGRRGILPSVEGRPPAIQGGSQGTGKNSPPLQKDKYGKYICPHCTKTYLHAKHLKRHMLRHTGIRPYECALCHDTFSRSDILKRHFQKCSMRRGNPSGQNHLEYSRANKKKRQEKEQQRLAIASQAVTMSTNIPTTQAYAPSLGSPIGLAAMNSPQQSYDPLRSEPLVNQVARHNQMRAMSSSNRGSLSSLNLENPPQSGTGQVTPDSVTTSGAATPYSHGYDQRGSSVSSPSGDTFNTMMSYQQSRWPQGFANSSLPHVAGDRNSSLEWNFPSAAADDFNTNPYVSGNNTPSHYGYAKEETDPLDLNSWPGLGKH